MRYYAFSKHTITFTNVLLYITIFVFLFVSFIFKIQVSVVCYFQFILKDACHVYKCCAWNIIFVPQILWMTIHLMQMSYSSHFHYHCFIRMNVVCYGSSMNSQQYINYSRKILLQVALLEVWVHIKLSSLLGFFRQVLYETEVMAKFFTISTPSPLRTRKMKENCSVDE